jgi:hypothetical protein
VDLLFPDQGLVWQLNQILASGVNYHLFDNAVTPTLSTILANLNEASFSGYALIGITWSWYTITGVSGHQGYAIGSPLTWTNTGGSPVDLYGYYVTDTGNSLLLAAAAFDNAPLSVPAGGTCLVLPSWGDFSQLSS